MMTHRNYFAVVLLAVAALTMTPKPAAAQSEPLIGQLMLVGFNFCPRGWAAAEGQLLPIAQNQALFSLFGTIYGGDGRTTFALPDLRGRAPIHFGTGPGLDSYQLGQRGGTESLTIGVNNMPIHNHDIQATNEVAFKGGPGNKYLGGTPAPSQTYHPGPPNKFMAPDAVTLEGGSQPLNKRSPYLAMRWCVATIGVYPSRN